MEAVENKESPDKYVLFFPSEVGRVKQGVAI